MFCFGFKFVAVSVIQTFSVTEGMEVHDSTGTENCIGTVEEIKGQGSLNVIRSQF